MLVAKPDSEVRKVADADDLCWIFGVNFSSSAILEMKSELEKFASEDA